MLSISKNTKGMIYQVKENDKVRVTNTCHMLFGAVGRVTKVRTYKQQRKALVVFSNFETHFYLSDLEVMA